MDALQSAGTGFPAATNARKLPELGPWGTALGILFVLACSAPLLTYIYVIHAGGGNNIGNDYLGIIPMAGQVLAGTYDWRNLLADTFNAQHWHTSPVLVHLLIAKYFYWDARLELDAGLLISALRVLLLFSILREPGDGKLKLWLFGGVLALVFSLSQASNFLYGIGALSGGLGLFGWTLGLWGICKCRNQSVGLAVMVAGGLISCSSWADVPPCWMAYLVALVLFNYRRVHHYVIWFLATVVGHAPYAYFLIASVLARHGQPAAHAHKVPAVLSINWSFLVNVLGRPFATNIAFDVGARKASEFAGYFGMTAAALSLLCLRFQPRFTPRVKASIVLMVYGLMGGLQLSLLRSWVMAWYTSYTIDFWVGLLGLSLSFIGFYLAKRRQKQPTVAGGAGGIRSLVEKVSPLIGLVTLCVIAVIYVSTNRTYEDKLIFLYARSPASEAAVRNYRIAPTYCESLVFQWTDGNPGTMQIMCEPLERHSVSAFAPTQQWSIQGDYPLHNVRLIQDDSAPTASWIPALQVDKIRSWKCYDHLNLYVPSPGKVVWTVDLPPDLESARLVTAFGIGTSKTRSSTGRPGAIDFDISAIRQEPALGARQEAKPPEPLSGSGVAQSAAEEPAKPASPAFPELPIQTLAHATVSDTGRWHSQAIPLTQFKGSRLAITFSSQARGAGDFAVFRYPHVDIKLAPKRPETSAPLAAAKAAPAVEVKPSNTDLSPFFPAETASDFIFPAPTANFWHAGTFSFPRVEQSGIAKVMAAADCPGIVSGDHLGIPLRRYSHLMVEMSAPPELLPRALKLFLKIDQGPAQSATIPLLGDGGIHRYTYDLKLLELPATARLDQISLSPADQTGLPEPDIIQIKRIKLISKAE